jgi:hypothetical protein
MPAVDHGGERVGVVHDLKMGDPAAVTADGQAHLNEVYVGTIAPGFGLRALGSDTILDVPHEHAVRLMRLGYIKVKRGHVLGGHFFVASDGIDRVEDDTVYLQKPVDPRPGPS